MTVPWRRSRLERGGPKRLAADRAVDVGDPQEHELRVARRGRGFSGTADGDGFDAAHSGASAARRHGVLDDALDAFDRRRRTARPSRRAPRRCSCTRARAASGRPRSRRASRWVDVTSSPCSMAVWSTRDAAFSSSGRNEAPSLGSTSSTPSRKPRPRTSRTISEAASADARSSRKPGPRSRTRSTRPRSTSRSRTARPTAEERGRRPRCVPQVEFARSPDRGRRRRAAGTGRRRAGVAGPSPFPTVTMSGSIGSW